VTELPAAEVESLSRATTFTFDDVSPRPGDQLPRPYHGFVFSGSSSNGIEDASTATLPGARNGVVSSPNVFVSDPQPMSVQPFVYGSVFTLESAYFTSALQNTLTIEATGITHDDELITKRFVVNGSGPTFVTFDWANVKEVEFEGICEAVYCNTQFVLDNLTITRRLRRR
jgi:hypothetical protein